MATIVALLLAPVLLLSLLTSQACGTLLSPDFYKEQLQDAQIYDFLYDDLLTTAVSDALETGDDLPAGVDLETDEVVSRVRDALPPDWLQEQAEAAIDGVGPYLLGDADSFTLTVALDERSGAAEAAASSLLGDVDLHEALFAEEVPDVVERRLGDGELPLGIHLTKDEGVAAVERVVTPEHVRSQQGVATEALSAFLVGREDTFDFNFSFVERTSAVERELREVFDDADLEGYVRREVLEPELDANVTADVALPLGVVVIREEIRAAIEGAATSAWLRSETLRLVDEVVPYLSARQDRFSLTVPLVERTDVAIDALTITVEDNYGRLLATLPVCTSAQLRELSQGQAVSLCRPQGFTTQDFLGAVGIDVERSLSGPVHEMAPDDVTFTEADLLAQTLGTEAGEMILDLRETMRDGLTIDEEDIREALAEQDEGLPEVLDTLRDGFREGWTWTEEDLRELVDDPEALDQARGSVGAFRIVAALISLLAVGMVTGAGFLGGRSLGGRLGWAGGALAFAALITAIIAGPIYSSAADGPLEDARAEIRDADDEAERILLSKLLDTAVEASDDIIGGIRLRAVLLLVLGIAGVAGGVALARRGRWGGARPGVPQEPPEEPEPVGATPPDEGEPAATEETPSEGEVDAEAVAPDSGDEAESSGDSEPAGEASAEPESSPEGAQDATVEQEPPQGDTQDAPEDGTEKPQST